MGDNFHSDVHAGGTTLAQWGMSLAAVKSMGFSGLVFHVRKDRPAASRCETIVMANQALMQGASTLVRGRE